MDSAVQAPPRRWVIGLAVVAAIVVVGLAITAISLLVWVRSYQPLAFNGGGTLEGNVRVIKDEYGVGAGDVDIVAPGEANHLFFLSHWGRWPITIDRVDPPASSHISFVSLARPVNSRGFSLSPAAHGWKVKIGRDGELQLPVRLRASCDGLPPHSYAPPASTIRVHYHYLRFFSRSQTLDISNLGSMVLACP